MSPIADELVHYLVSSLDGQSDIPNGIQANQILPLIQFGQKFDISEPEFWRFVSSSFDSHLKDLSPSDIMSSMTLL